MYSCVIIQFEKCWFIILWNTLKIKRRVKFYQIPSIFLLNLRCELGPFPSVTELESLLSQGNYLGKPICLTMAKWRRSYCSFQRIWGSMGWVDWGGSELHTEFQSITNSRISTRFRRRRSSAVHRRFISVSSADGGGVFLWSIVRSYSEQISANFGSYFDQIPTKSGDI